MTRKETTPSYNLDFAAAREQRLTLGVDIFAKDAYEPYLDALVEMRKKLGIVLPNKAMSQVKMQPLNINEETTRLIEGQDLPTLYRYIETLLLKGRHKIWISTCIKNDVNDHHSKNKSHANLFNDPRGKSRPREEPPLGINSLDDLDKLMPEILEFRKKNPEMLFKVFPQDKPNPNSIKILRSNKFGDDRLVLTVRPGENTSNDRTSNDIPARVIEINLNGPIPVILLKSAKDIVWLRMLLNSRDQLDLIDQAGFTGSSFLDVEALFFQRPNSTYKISIVQDVIVGESGKSRSKKNHSCPKIAPVIDKLREEPVILVINSSKPRIHSLLSLRNSIIQPGRAEMLHAQVVEANQSSVLPDPETLKAFMQSLIESGFAIPSFLDLLIQGDRAIRSAGSITVQDNHGKGVDINHGYKPQYPIVGNPPRINMLTEKEKPTIKDIVAFDALLNNLIRRINISISQLQPPEFVYKKMQGTK